jgi:hypothetical protein
VLTISTGDTSRQILVARLDKTGQRVLCGMPRCRGELAYVRAPGQPGAYIYFARGSGQARSDQVFVPSRHDAGRLIGARDGPWERKRPKARRGPSERYGGRAMLRPHPIPTQAPVIARCPLCRRLSELRSDTLGVHVLLLAQVEWAIAPDEQLVCPCCRDLRAPR